MKKKKIQRFDPTEASNKALEAITRARSSLSTMNYPQIFAGFEAMGIPTSDINPRENIFTFQAWKALGRVVRKGQHGVRCVTFQPTTRTQTDPETGETKEKRGKRPWTTTVFHISQTEPIEEWEARRKGQRAKGEEQGAEGANVPAPRVMPTAPCPMPQAPCAAKPLSWRDRVRMQVAA